jgi:hypothetical protein
MKFQFAALFLTVFAGLTSGQPALTAVYIYVDSHDDSDRLLRPGAPVASDIFKKVGIRLNWRSGEIRPAPNALALRTLEHAPASATSEALAASRFVDASRIEITVYEDRLQGFLDGHSKLARVGVGYVLAHELAHAMQGFSRHADCGILKAHWTDDDFNEMVFRKLVFTADDVKLIHQGLARRVAAAGSPAASSGGKP